MEKTLAGHSINHLLALDMGGSELKHQFTAVCGLSKGSRGAILSPLIKLD